VRRKLSRRPRVITDFVNGYRTTRLSGSNVCSLLEERLEQSRPDVVIVQGARIDGLVKRTVSANVPVVIRLVTEELVDDLARSARDDPVLRAHLEGPLVAMHAESQFIADRVTAQLELPSEPIYPLIDRERIIASRHDRRFVTFVNPSPVKGVGIALEMVRLLPEREFLFVESWPLPEQRRAELREQAAQLPNLWLEPAADDVSMVWARTAVLLVPSQWQEAFGRVAVEAAANGVPQLASRVGGLPEAVGDGGLILDPHDPPERWARELNRLLTDGELYERLSLAAQEHSSSPILDPDQICNRFLASVQRLLPIPVPAA